MRMLYWWGALLFYLSVGALSAIYVTSGIMLAVIILSATVLTLTFVASVYGGGM